MPGTACVLTDSTAQFSQHDFPGREQVTIITLDAEAHLPGPAADTPLQVEDLPPTARLSLEPVLCIPSAEQFRQKYLQLAAEYNEIVVVLHSSHLSSCVSNAQEAASAVRGRISVQVIDSLTISVGLGYLVQVAAGAATRGVLSTEIERSLRGIIPHIYSVFCIPGLTYLQHAGFLGKSQALVGEMLNLLPVFSLEEGILTPVEKVRNPRHLLDFLQEFVDEFSEIRQIAIVMGMPPLTQDIKVLKDHAALAFPHTPVSEHTISLPVAALFGPRTLGVFVIEEIGES